MDYFIGLYICSESPSSFILYVCGISFSKIIACKSPLEAYRLIIHTNIVNQTPIPEMMKLNTTEIIPKTSIGANVINM